MRNHLFRHSEGLCVLMLLGSRFPRPADETGSASPTKKREEEEDVASGLLTLFVVNVCSESCEVTFGEVVGTSQQTKKIEAMAQSEKSPIKIYGNDALSTRLTAFQKKADEPYKKKKANPFSKSPSSTPVQGLASTTDETEVMATSPVKIYGNDSLATRVATFQKKAEDHHKKQKANPFSAVGGTNLGHPKWDKNDPRYGRPVEGSKTDQRGKAAGAHIGNEVQYLCSIISEFGCLCEDGSTVISFGELFELYSRISNKVVGMLLRARKHGLIYFEGEMLFQRRDDDVIITLFKPIEVLREEWGVKPASATQKRKQNEECIMSPEDY